MHGDAFTGHGGIPSRERGVHRNDLASYIVTVYLDPPVGSPEVQGQGGERAGVEEHGPVQDLVAGDVRVSEQDQGDPLETRPHPAMQPDGTPPAVRDTHAVSLQFDNLLLGEFLPDVGIVPISPDGFQGKAVPEMFEDRCMAEITAVDHPVGRLHLAQNGPGDLFRRTEMCVGQDDKTHGFFL